MLFHSHNSKSYLVTVNQGQMEVVEIVVQEAEMHAEYYDKYDYNGYGDPILQNTPGHTEYILEIAAKLGQSKVFKV